MASRLPSIYGSTAVPIAPVGVPIVQNEEQDPGLDIWGFLRRRKSFIIVLGMLGAGVSYLLFQRQDPVYRSVALVQVIQKNNGTDSSDLIALDRGLKDAPFEIKSPGLIGSAYQNHQLSELTMLQGLTPSAAGDTIASMIEVTTGLDKTNVVEIAIEGVPAEEIPRVANAVAQEYVSRQMENYKDARGELVTLLLAGRDNLHKELKLKEEEYKEFRKRSGLMSDGRNPHRERQQAYLTQLASLSVEEAALKAELTTLEEALRGDGSREAILLAIGKLTDKLPSNHDTDEATKWARSMEERMIPLILEQKDLEMKLGKDHPKVGGVQRRIEFTRQLLQKFAATKEAESNVPPDFIAAYVQSLRQQLQSLTKQRQDLQAQAAEAEQLARLLANDENEDRSRTSEISRLTRQFDDTSTQLMAMKINAEVGAIHAQVLFPARMGELVFPILTKFLGIGALLGGMVGIGIGYLVEMADRSFRRPEDIIREFGIPIVGHIPFMKEQKQKSATADTAMDQSAVCFHLPRSRAAEAFRSVRTAVCFSATGNTHRVIQVSSPAAGDGKSTLALNLSISLAMSGKRTILVESDFRRPKVHKLTGVANKRGIVDVLRGDTELTDAVQSTIVESFFVLPCGSRPKNPAELLSRPEYEQLLDVLRGKYDYVIVDTPPILAVTDPTAVAPRVDGILIAMRLTRQTRDLGRRTLEQLRDVGATVSGVVINGVEESDAYGYGSYRYSDYQYKYKSYGYQYGEYGKSKTDYYTDDRGDSSDADILLKSDSE